MLIVCVEIWYGGCSSLFQLIIRNVLIEEEDCKLLSMAECVSSPSCLINHRGCTPHQNLTLRMPQGYSCFFFFFASTSNCVCVCVMLCVGKSSMLMTVKLYYVGFNQISLFMRRPWKQQMLKICVFCVCMCSCFFPL